MNRTQGVARALVAVTSVGLAVAVVTEGPAGAQGDPSSEGTVVVDFDLGPYDPELGDWPVAAVQLRGALDEGEPVAVDLFDTANAVLWSGTATVSGSSTSVAVGDTVGIGEVAGVRVSQAGTVVAEVVVEGARTAVPDHVREPDPAPEPEAPAVEGVQVEGGKAEVLHQGGGLGSGGSGPLAVSMILAVVVVAIVFRSPLPSASTQRWTK